MTSHTVASIAEILKVRQHAVLGLIRSGQLRAVNIALKVGGKPRWRIMADDLEAFFVRRTFQAAGPRASRRKRNRNIVQYF